MRNAMVFIAGMLMAISSSLATAAQNKITPGELIVEPPTLLCLGFEWNITGDDNRNAKVEVWYRKKGDQNWKPALPMMRLQNELINNYNNSPDNAVFAKAFNYTAPNMFAGSIVDLEPDTTYETRFLMSDPDGLVGNNVGNKGYRYATVRTRAEPRPFAGGRILHIYPEGYVGEKKSPAFTGLMAAYDPLNPSFVTSSGAQPGDTLLIHAGTYTVTASDSPKYLLNRSGTAEKPIVIKSAGDGEVIFEGQNSPVLFDVMGGNYHYFEGLTIRNTGIGIIAGDKNVGGANGLTVKKCRFENVANGIWAMYAGSKNFYIVDNTILGRQQHDVLVGGGGGANSIWKNAPGFPAQQYASDYGIHLYGAGHVVAYNEIAYFWDGINTSFYNELPSTKRELQPVSNDFYNNYIHAISDNATSIEEQLHNARMFRNLLIDVAGSGPIGLTHNWGGPLYVFRNIVYHSPGSNALKFFGATGGILLYNNTLVSETAMADILGGPFGSLATRSRGVSNVDFRNNLVLGAESSTKVPSRFKTNFNGVYYAATYTSYTVSDYNGFRPNANASPQFVWLAPSKGLRDYEAPMIEHTADTLPQLCAATGQECHGRLVDYDIFEKVSQPDRNNHTKLYPKELFDFRLKPNTAAVDAGFPLPNITDGFTGAAPDLGALELGQAATHYGPRP